MRNPYAVLGVPKSATASEIKAAFRKKAMKCHPDRNPDDPQALDRFKDITLAYNIVGQEDQRRLFDAGRINSEGKPAGRNSFVSVFAATLSRHILHHKRPKPTGA
ncbi:MAG: J domain-containing protein [Pseudomonadota bacterium]